MPKQTKKYLNLNLLMSTQKTVFIFLAVSFMEFTPINFVFAPLFYMIFHLY
jgi:hypothetical protein